MHPGQRRRPSADAHAAETRDPLVLTADDGLVLNAFTAVPGSASADALNMLASWAATPVEAAAGSERGEG